jgi:Rhs element Vgr protein
MANKSTVVTKDIDLVSLVVTVGGKELGERFQLVEVEVKKEVNKIPTATVIVLDGSPHKVEFKSADSNPFKPGDEVKISAGYHQKTKVLFEGIVQSHNGKVKGNEISEVVLKCVDKAIKLTLEPKNENFADMTDADIFRKVLGGFAGKIEATTEKHERMVKYSSTAWDFALMRAEVMGLILVVDKGKVNVVKPTVSGPALTLTYGTDIIKMDVDVDAKNQVKKVTAEGWDYSKNQIVVKTAKEPTVPKAGDMDGVALSGKSSGGGDIKLNSNGPILSSYLQRWADSVLLRRRLGTFQGNVHIQGSADINHDNVVTLNGVARHLKGDHYVGGVKHTIKDSDWNTTIMIGLDSKFFSDRQNGNSTQAAPAAGMAPALSGLQIGTVQKIHADPQGETRVLVDIPVITAKGDGLWARLGTNYATKKAGFFTYPEIGDEVVCGFLNEDPRFPIILCSVPGKSHETAYTPDDKNTYKAFTSNSKMKIEFEDVKKILTIWTPNKNYMIFSDDKGSITIEDENKNKMVMDSKGINFYTPFDFVVKADGNIKMESKMKTELKAKMDFSIESSMNVNNKASIANTMKGATCEVNGSGMTTIKGGVVMIN